MESSLFPDLKQKFPVNLYSDFVLFLWFLIDSNESQFGQNVVINFTRMKYSSRIFCKAYKISVLWHILCTPDKNENRPLVSIHFIVLFNVTCTSKTGAFKTCINALQLLKKCKICFLYLKLAAITVTPVL